MSTIKRTVAISINGLPFIREYDEDGGSVDKACLKTVPYEGRYVVYLPENAANRKYLDSTKFTDEELTLEYKATKVLGPKGEPSSRPHTKTASVVKNWQEHCTDAELEEIAQLNASIEAIKVKAIARGNDPAAVLQRKIAILQAELEKLKA